MPNSSSDYIKLSFCDWGICLIPALLFTAKTRAHATPPPPLRLAVRFNYFSVLQFSTDRRHNKSFDLYTA